MTMGVGRKFLCTVLSLMLIFSMISGVLPASAADVQDTGVKDSGPILQYNFKFDNQGATQIPDNSGHGNTGELKNYTQGGASIVDDTIYGRAVKALSLKGGSDGGYLQMPQNIFDKASSVTISCWVKVKSDSGYQRIWDFGTGTSSYMYLLTDGYNDGATGYAAAITNAGWSKEQTAQMGTTLNKNQWIFTTVVLDSANHTLSLYKDGALISRNTKLTLSVSDLGKTTNNYIGYGQYGDAPIGGEFADFNIYNYAMTDSQISDMCIIPDEDKLAADKTALRLGDISQVTGDLTLPDKGASGSTITWSSDHPSVISDDGKVTRPAANSADVKVTLTAKMTYGTKTDDKMFEVTVLAYPNDQQVVQHDVAAVNLGNLESVISDLTLPTKGDWGSSITWVSSDKNVITNDGKVIRPSVGAGKAQIILTATAQINGTKLAKDYKITVLPAYYIPAIKTVPDIHVSTPAGTSPKLPNCIDVTYTSGATGTVNLKWPAIISADKYAKAGTFEVSGTVIDTTTTVKATVTVTEKDTGVGPVLEAIESNLSAVDLTGDTILTQNRQRDINYLKQLNADRMLYNFRKAFGQDTKSAEPLGGWDAPDGLLRGHSTGHYLSALALAYSSTKSSTDTQMVDDNAAIKAKMEYMVSELSKLQDMSAGVASDFTTKCTSKDAAQSKWSTDPAVWGKGFLSAYSPDQFALLEQYTPYSTIWAPYYTYHKILAGMIDCYTYGGDETALKVAKGMGDWVYSRLSKCTPEQRNKMWDMYIAGEYGGMNESLTNLYQITKDSKYLDAAKMFDNKTFFDNLSKNVDDIRTRHANQHIPQIVGAIKEYAATGDKYYYNVASNFWDMVTSRYAYSIGGVGTGEKFTEPFEQAESIDTDKNCETCAAYNMLKLTKELYAYDPDNAKYMDYYERTLLNQVAASQNQADENSDNVTYMLPVGPGQSKGYSDDYQSFTCCHGTGMENHVKYQEATYYHSKDNSKLYVNLYMPTQYNWTEKGIVLKQETEFPSDYSKFTIKGNATFELKLHVPYWATKGYTVKVNGETVVTSAKVSSYTSIKRDWKDGDTVEVSMPYDLHLDKTPDKIGDSTVASVMYGPIVMVGKNSDKDYITLTLSPKLTDSIAVKDSGASKDAATLTTNGITLVPMYTAYNFAYHTYFKINTPANGDEPDKTALLALYNADITKEKGNYSDSSWAAFTAALTKAKIILGSGGATQSDIDSAKSALEAAEKALSSSGSIDKTSLWALYVANKDREKGTYTDSSWSAFTAALAKAKTVLNSGSATQNDVDQAAAALTNAQKGLTEQSGHHHSDDNSNNKTNSAPSDATSTVAMTETATGGTVATVTPTTSSVPTVTGNKSDVSVTVSSDVSSVIASATAEKPAEVKITVPTASIIEQLQNSAVQTVGLTIQVPAAVANNTNANATVTIRAEQAALQAAKETKKDVVVTVVNAETGKEAYSWTFKGADLASSTAPVKSVDLAMSVSPTAKVPEVNAVTQSNQGLVLKFANNGVLPSAATIKINAVDLGYKAGQSLYFYYYNPVTKTLETVGDTAYTVDAYGFVSITITHCSDYVLLPKAARSLTLDTLTYTVAPKKSYQIGVKLANASGVTVKVYSSSSGVATVTKLNNGNYNVTGVKAGTTYIMVDVLDKNNKRLTHASVKVNVAKGAKSSGISTRQVAVF